MAACLCSTGSSRPLSLNSRQRGKCGEPSSSEPNISTRQACSISYRDDQLMFLIARSVMGPGGGACLANGNQSVVQDRRVTGLDPTSPQSSVLIAAGWDGTPDHLSHG